jgi:hypothetical protein
MIRPCSITAELSDIDFYTDTELLSLPLTNGIR